MIFWVFDKICLYIKYILLMKKNLNSTNYHGG